MENIDDNLDINFTFQCKQKWNDLQTTPNPDIRFCNECNLNVHSIVDRLDLEKLEIGEKCVAVKTNLSDREGWISILGGVERSLSEYPPRQEFTFNCGAEANLNKDRLSTLHFLRRQFRVRLDLKKQQIRFTAWCAYPEELDRIERILERDKIVYSIE